MRTLRRQRGFSLIEVMVSGVLLIVGMAAALSVYGTIANQQNHTSHRSTAGTIAEAVLEDLVLRYPGDPSLTVGLHDEGRAFDADGARAAPSDAVFTATWRVQAYAKLKTIREITVTVVWNDSIGARTLEVTTWRN